VKEKEQAAHRGSGTPSTGPAGGVNRTIRPHPHTVKDAVLKMIRPHSQHRVFHGLTARSDRQTVAESVSKKEKKENTCVMNITRTTHRFQSKILKLKHLAEECRSI
jgi:hypothetical protein